MQHTKHDDRRLLRIFSSSGVPISQTLVIKFFDSAIRNLAHILDRYSLIIKSQRLDGQRRKA